MQQPAFAATTRAAIQVADAYTGIDLPGGIIFNTMNTSGVRNRPTRPATFDVTRPVTLTGIITYHWNDGLGAMPGTIALRGPGGTLYGPWQAAGAPGSGGVHNAFWYVQPGIRLQPGTYRIIDSEPATWSQDDESGNRGMGEVLASAPQATPTGDSGMRSSSGGSDWSAQADKFRGQNGTRYTYSCPAGGTPSGRLWGTDLYTDDSSVCTAAVHAGLIGAAQGGTVVIEIRSGAAAYTGSTRNGVSSRDYGNWSGSFAFVGASSGRRSQTNNGGSDWSAQADRFRGQNGARYSYSCPAGGTPNGRLWGTDLYTDDSSVCTAAVHAGLIGAAQGGTVVIEIRSGAAAYTGSTRNGVSSRDYGNWSGSFAFVR